MVNKIDEKGLVSIIMGIYNCQDTLERAIDSILNQTYTKWELILCDDGSTDNTYNVAKGYADRYPKRIILLQNEHNLGLNATLNRCLKIANGEFIARMDGDDISMPERLDKEVKFLCSNLEYVLVSTGSRINDGNRVIGIRYNKEHPTKIDVFKHGCFLHAAVMIRREAIMSVGGYTEDKRLLRVEDYNLWTKIYAKGYKGANLMDGLYEVSETPEMYNRRKLRYRINGAYAKVLAIKMLKLPPKYYLVVVLGIIKGIIPIRIYHFLHERKVKRSII